MENKEVKYVAFYNQKGGVGKSTFTMMAASYLHYVKGFNMAVIDTDYPQWSIKKIRDRELELLQHSEPHQQMLQKQFAQTGRKLYPIVGSEPSSAIVDLLGVLKGDERDFDIVLVDLPGTARTSGIVSTIANLDHIFMPIVADRLTMESALSFAGALNESVVGRKTSNLKGIHLFWNMVDKRENTPLYEVYEKIISDMDLSLLKSQIPDRKKFKKETVDTEGVSYRSTVFAPDKKFVRESGFDTLMDEICELIML